jgi:hypothetical protein
MARKEFIKRIIITLKRLSSIKLIKVLEYRVLNPPAHKESP